MNVLQRTPEFSLLRPSIGFDLLERLFSLDVTNETAVTKVRQDGEWWFLRYLDILGLKIVTKLTIVFVYENNFDVFTTVAIIIFHIYQLFGNTFTRHVFFTLS